MQEAKEFFHDKICFKCAENPKKAITYAWFSSMVLVFIAFIIGCSVATQTEHKSLGFAAVWTTLLLVALSVGGTMTLRRYTTPLALGVFQGVVIVMANQCLILFGIFVGESTSDNGAKTAAGWFASFCLFLCINYAVFGAMLALFLADLVKDLDLDLDVSGGGGGGGEQAKTEAAE